jgi:anti-sigma factor RsiW
MPTITREQLAGYLDDLLSARETAQVEQALRESEALRRQLRGVMQERDRGEHSVGAIWRRNRLTCPTREQLGSYLLGVLEPDLQDYVTFHLETVGCAYCQANLADLRSLQKEPAPRARERRQRFFQSSAGYLRPADGETDRPGRTKK